MTKALELAKFGRETPPTGVVVGDSDTQTLSSKTFSDGPVFSGLNANAIPYLNASKVLSSSSTFVFDGTNIGIGIASPAYKLDVRGQDARLSSGASGSYAIFRVGGAGSDSIWGYAGANNDVVTGSLAGDTIFGSNKASANLHFLSGNGSLNMTLSSSGNLGVGTKTPGAKLTVQNGSVEDTSGSIIRMELSGINPYWEIQGLNGGTSASRKLNFYTNAAGGGGSVLTLLQSGNVGIGTTSPISKLGISGDITLGLGPNPNGSYGALTWRYGNSSSFGTAGYIDVRQVSAGNSGYMVFATNNSTPDTADATERMRISNAGNVGINEQNPQEKLHVAGKVRVFDGGYPYIDLGVSTSNYFRFIHDNPNDRLIIGKNGATAMVVDGSNFVHFYAQGTSGAGTINLTSADSFIRLNSTGGTADKMKWDIRAISASGSEALEFRTINNANTVFSTKLWISHGGNVGIGNTNPAYKLHVSGTVGVNSGYTSGNFGLFVQGLGAGSADARAAHFRGFGGQTTIGGTGPTIVLQNADGTTNNITKLSFETASNGEAVSINCINTDHGNFYGDMAFNTRGSAGYSEKLRIMANGNVGVGNTAPVVKLHIEGSAAIGTVGTERILVMGRAVSGGVSFPQAASFDLGRHTATDGIYSSHTRLDLGLKDNQSQSNYDTNVKVMSWLNNGNVGVGITSPLGRLEVANGANAQHIRISDNNHDGSSSTFRYPALSYYARRDNNRYNGAPLSDYGSTASIVFTDRPGTSGYPNFCRTSDIEFWTATNTGGTALDPKPIKRVIITAEGNFLLGTENPNPFTDTSGTGGLAMRPNRLFVSSDNDCGSFTKIGSDGIVWFWAKAGSGNVGNVSVSSSGTAYNSTSDYRLKNVTGALTGYKERLMGLQPKQGTWIADDSEFRGFLAHDFANQYPKSVTGEKDAVDDEGKPIMQSMQASTSEVMADLIAMVKDLITENESLKARLDAANL